MTITLTINLWYILYFLLTVAVIYAAIGLWIGAAFFIATTKTLGFKETVKEINWKCFLLNLFTWPTLI